MLGIGGGTAIGRTPGFGDMRSAGGPERAIPGFKKGGKVRKTGLVKAHEGERVLTKKQQKSDLKSSAKKRMR